MTSIDVQILLAEDSSADAERVLEYWLSLNEPAPALGSPTESS
jgi:hypothetical protein